MTIHEFYFFKQKSYEALPLDQRANLLFSALPPGGDVPDEGRQLAAVMLRRLLTTDFEAFFSKLPEEQKAQFKTQLLSVLQNEPNPQVGLVLQTSQLYEGLILRTHCRSERNWWI